jgi:hypothetical protein
MMSTRPDGGELCCERIEAPESRDGVSAGMIFVHLCQFIGGHMGLLQRH